MILYKNNIIVTPVKTGTSTLHHILFKQGAACLFADAGFLNWGPVDSPGHKFYEQVKAEQIIKEPEWNPHAIDHSFVLVPNKKVFLSVRNPYDRLISYYYYYVLATTAKKAIWADKSWNSFTDFVLGMGNPADIGLSLLNHYATIKANGFIRVEHLLEDLEKIGLKLNAEQMLWLNKNTKKPVGINFADYYTKELLEVVNIWCKPEAEFFGYPYLIWNDQTNTVEEVYSDHDSLSKQPDNHTT